MQMQNKVSLDYKDNPELREAFAGKKVGDKCQFTVELQIDEMNDEGIVGSVESITPDDADARPQSESDDEDEITPDSDSPVMLVFSGQKKAEGKK